MKTSLDKGFIGTRWRQRVHLLDAFVVREA